MDFKEGMGALKDDRAKCLLHKAKDLSPIPSSHIKSEIVAQACDFIYGERGNRDQKVGDLLASCFN